MIELLKEAKSEIVGGLVTSLIIAVLGTMIELLKEDWSEIVGWLTVALVIAVIVGIYRVRLRHYSRNFSAEMRL